MWARVTSTGQKTSLSFFERPVFNGATISMPFDERTINNRRSLYSILFVRTCKNAYINYIVRITSMERRNTMKNKKITRVHRATGGHWVGDGFPVSTMFSYHNDQHDISPFLLLDHAGPAAFEPSDFPRGVEEHPHRGFETVTIVYQGEVEHRDNAGNSGKIGPGDVQWMTAGRGILHEEMHGMDFTRKGGTLEMIQLWVNLPAKDKM